MVHAASWQRKAVQVMTLGISGAGDPLMPCGRCRQLLWENGGPTLQLMTSTGVRPMTEVLPHAFALPPVAPQG